MDFTPEQLAEMEKERVEFQANVNSCYWAMLKNDTKHHWHPENVVSRMRYMQKVMEAAMAQKQALS